MKPNNNNTKNCESISSRCVIWDGPTISCISGNICNGDSIDKVTYELAERLCEILDQLDISTYDLSCLVPLGGTPTDFKSFINLLIAKICATPAQQSSTQTSTVNCTDCNVNFAPAFYYNDPGTGDTVTSGPIQGYVQRVGLSVGNLINQIAVNQAATSNLNERVTALENTPQPKFTLPELYPTGIATPNSLLPLTEFVTILEQQFVELRTATGDTTDIYNAITTFPSDFNSAKALGATGGVMGTLPGWIEDPKSLSDSFINVQLAILDLRGAVRNIQLNILTACEDIQISLVGTLENKILKLFFTGSIPTDLSSCQTQGSLFTVTDDSGNFFKIMVDVQNNLNNASGVVIDLNSTSLNFADDLKVISNALCFSNVDTGTMCSQYIETVVNNNFNCPTLNVVPASNSVAFSFTHTSGTLTYSVQLFDNTNTMIQSQNYSVSSATIITGDFSSLISNSLYRIRLQMITSNNTKTCPLTAFSTLPNVCPAPNTVTSILEYV